MSMVNKIIRSVETRIGFNMFIQFNSLSISSVRTLDQDWRAKKGLTKNPNAFGALTNLADYTFLDGRPTPYGIRQKTRINKQINYAQRIKKLISEVDYAVERHNKKQKEMEERRNSIISNKLKPKGDLLLEKSDKN
ncbi:39S ribosomal protein L52, mitochondrial [Cephus cinctus]|uniref:Large ribosomal subunit protein mL52 n=1 Tax=Cephus cinctus TaxID=211228 RepID=A0AAJ7BVC8_CEPCN|nr:39S ribosomal protein L52, mitochondrial [Cephus cinctus]